MSALLRRRARGAAAVELAVTCIVLVPLLMYMVFLQDMLVMKLDGQEAAAQAPWDFILQDYDRGFTSNNVARMSRLTYCDHTAAYDSYDRGYDCDDQIHHKAMTAHECWIVQGGQQVSCDISPVNVGRGGDGVTAVKDSFANGGLLTCSARLGIMNYYLPNLFMPNFIERKGNKAAADAAWSKKKMQSRWASGNSPGPAQDNAHTDGPQNTTASGDSSTTANYWRLAPTRVSMLVDTYALFHEPGMVGVQTVNPGDRTGPLYRRVDAVYQQVARDAVPRVNDFRSQMGRFLSGRAGRDGSGDDVRTPEVAFRKGSARQDFTSTPHWAAGWGDQRAQQTNAARVDGYWGQARP